MEHGDAQAIAVGGVTALVGFTSSVAVVIAGLGASGATPAQASSGIAALCLTVGVGTMLLAWRHRTPLTLAWSTPGAALLATQGAPSWPEAVAAFALTGVLILATGVWARLGRLVAAIPVSLAQAMLAGVLVPLCLAPVMELAAAPAVIAPVVILWLVLQRWAPRWSTPAAFALALAIIVALARSDLTGALTLPRLALASPSPTWAAVGLAVPLAVVTMASQNVPGVAVLKGAGYRVPWRGTMLVTGAATVAGAAAGGHAVNLAAITAALPASPEAHPDPRRRWIAAASAGAAYVLLAGAGATLVALADAGPEGLLPAVAGLALLPTLASSLAGAFHEAAGRLPAAATFAMAASGVAIGGIGAAFWALVVGLATRWWLGRQRQGREA
ncbi:benzoate/H(+) symporter BenE family transporter [Demequina lignilytica]|uniref:Benzoate/H(+) symporter BenE family transporter n=1 Tax=Demequina lignilytica TaxID=3051663 RepID=A0AB35MIE6_9MICO|nr:benzoate/H(+) symporter BenE family transporter [Demequina sp. SYSU T0a273]MDN4483430.1 benzoate/H(+) symporter BenE family transporter [Demequina sp. SYSU T0a273]